MNSDHTLIESELDESSFTSLFACICEEEDGYTIQLRLLNEAQPQYNVWGEEIADSFEAAATLISSVAAQFSISQERIRIQIRMLDITEGARH